MSPQILNGLICTVGTIVQAVAAGVFLFDRISPKAGTMLSSKGKAWTVTILLILSVFLAGWVSHWVWNFNPEPIVVEKTVTVEKPVPCPPSKTGAATTKGRQSPAISGTGTVTYGSSPAAQPPKNTQ